MREKIKKIFSIFVRRKKITIVVAVVLLVVISIGVFVYIRKAEERKEIRIAQETYQEFIRLESGLEMSRARALIGFISEEYQEFYKNCEEIEEYNELADKDSRDMSIKELERVIELHPRCGYTFFHKRNAALRIFNDEISELFGIIPKIKDIDKANLAKQIADYWREVSSIERDIYTLETQTADNFKSYWSIELEYSKNKMTLSTRNERFDKLNKEIEDSNKEIDEKRNEILDLVDKKNDLLSQFKVGVLPSLKLPSLDL